MILKDVIGYEGEYAITECGKVWSYRWGRWVKTCINSHGYYRTDLKKNDKYRTKYIHRLLAEAFIDNPENKEEVDHIDGNRLNNNLSNLRWTTKAENQHNQKRAKGYCWHKHIKKWMAYIRVNSKLINLGRYDTEDGARQAYLEAKKIYHPSSPIV